MAKPVNCRYFYGDYFRGKNKEECRLLDANPNNTIPWQRKMCDTCPVPETLITSNCRDLLLEAEVRRTFLRNRVEITLAICSKHMLQLEDPTNCPQCAQDNQ